MNAAFQRRTALALDRNLIRQFSRPDITNEKVHCSSITARRAIQNIGQPNTLSFPVVVKSSLTPPKILKSQTWKVGRQKRWDGLGRKKEKRRCLPTTLKSIQLLGFN